MHSKTSLYSNESSSRSSDKYWYSICDAAFSIGDKFYKTLNLMFMQLYMEEFFTYYQTVQLIPYKML